MQPDPQDRRSLLHHLRRRRSRVAFPVLTWVLAISLGLALFACSLAVIL